jgi:alkylation response protein AidB-like acyl-CoA dehydrogenase
MAHVADVGELLVRTDPAAGKHAGLTMMLVDMAQPGITVRPLRQMTGGAAFNEVFLEDVAVPTADVVGELGQGWLVAGTSRNAERIAMMRGAGPLRPELLARYAELVGRQAPTDPVGIGRAVAAVVAMQELAGREVDAWPRLGAVAGSVSKLALVDAVSRIDATLPGLLGPALHQPLPDQDDWSSYVLGQHGLHLAGGSDEIHLNLVAQRGLGLPR